jgi:hypothetical protein
MKNIIKRDDLQYIEIENFEDYELTSCIAFEMAIRNKDALTHLEILNSIIVGNVILDELKTDKTNKITAVSKDRDNNEYGEDISIPINLEKWNESQEILRNDFFIFAMGTEYWLKFYNFSKYYVKDSTFNYISENPNTEPYFLDNKLFLNDEIKDGVYIYTETTDIKYSLYRDLLKGKIKEGFPIKNINKYIKSNHQLTHSISNSFKRPRLVLPDNISKEVDLKNLNLNLPIDELTSYIKKIKNLYNISPEVFKTPIEFLDEKLLKVEEEIIISRPKGKKEKIKLRNHISNKLKFADMFYIYDAVTIGMSKSKIQIELTYYWNEKANKDTLFDQKTITKYYQIAKEYIDKLKYKELITGFTYEKSRNDKNPDS